MASLLKARELILEMEPLYRTQPEVAHARLRQETDSVLAEGDLETGLVLLDELAWQATARFDTDDALPLIQQLLECAEQLGQPEWVGRANNTYGAFFLNAGEPLAAIDRLILALEAFESVGNNARVASVLANIGEMLIEMGDVERAGPFLEEAACLGESMDRPELHINMVVVLAEQGLLPEAWNRVLRVWREGRSQNGWEMRARAHELAGWLRNRQGETGPSVRHLKRAIGMYEAQSDPFRSAMTRLLLGDVYLGQNQRESAAMEFKHAADISGTFGYRQLEIKALRKLLPVTTGPVDGLSAHQRLVTALQQADARNRFLRRNFVDIRIRSEEMRQERLRLEQDVEYDALTGLLSCRNFSDRLSRLATSHSCFALLFLDVDKLKALNDRMGHVAGDMLLRSFANDLADALPKGGLAFRKSGDEFLVVLPDAQRDEAERYLQDLFARLRVERRIGAEAMVLSGSAGVVLWPSDATSVAQLEWYADQAMYRAKASGRNRWAWHAEMVQG